MPTDCGYRCVDGFDVGAPEWAWNVINAADPECSEHWTGCTAQTVFWPEEESCEARCFKDKNHSGAHEDEILGEWDD